MNKIEIETECGYSQPETFITSSGTHIRIGTNELDTFYKYRALPPADKIELFDISLIELDKYLKGQIRKQKQLILELFSQTWLDKMTGEPVDFNDLIEYSEIDLTYHDIIKKCKGRAKLNFEKAQAIIDIFLSENAEIYRKEDE